MTTNVVDMNNLPAGAEPGSTPSAQTLAAQTPAATDGIKPAPVSDGTKPPVPDWVPEKFRSAPDPIKAMADAYAELEKKQGSQKEEAARGEAKQDAPAALDFDALEAEYAANGELSQETYDKLAKAGITKASADRYIASVVAEATRNNAEFYAMAGGEKEFGEVVQWASKNVKESELNAYNALIEAGNFDAAKLIFRSFVEAKQATTSTLPERTLRATSAADLTGVKAFASRAEISKAMSDPRYATDPAYREQVYARMAVTDV